MQEEVVLDNMIESSILGFPERQRFSGPTLENVLSGKVKLRELNLKIGQKLLDKGPEYLELREEAYLRYVGKIKGHRPCLHRQEYLNNTKINMKNISESLSVFEMDSYGVMLDYNIRATSIVKLYDHVNCIQVIQFRLKEPKCSVRFIMTASSMGYGYYTPNGWKYFRNPSLMKLRMKQSFKIQ